MLSGKNERSPSIQHGPIPAERIMDMASRISSGIEGVSVYLFGSYAYGKPNRQSDVDLAVIYPDQLASHRLGVMARYLAGHPEIPKDVIAIRFSRFERLGATPGTLSYRIKQEGVSLG